MAGRRRRRRPRRPRKNSDERFRLTERRALESGDPFAYARVARDRVAHGDEDPTVQAWALLAEADWEEVPTGNQGRSYYKIAEGSQPIRVFVTGEGGRPRPLDVGHVSFGSPVSPEIDLEYGTINPRARDHWKAMGHIRVFSADTRRRKGGAPPEFTYSLLGAPWEVATRIEVKEPGAKPKRKKRASSRPRAIRLGTKRSRKIFEQAIGGNSYTLYHNFVPQPISADYIRTEMEADARKTKKSMSPQGDGKYGIHYHGNHWVEFWSPAEEEVPADVLEKFAPKAVAPEPEAPPAVKLTAKQRKKLIAAIYKNTAKDFRAGGRSAPSIMIPVSRGGGLLDLNLASDEELVATGWDKAKYSSDMHPIMEWVEGRGPEPKRTRKAKATAPQAAPPVAEEAPPGYLEQAELFQPDPQAVAAYGDRLDRKGTRLEERAERQREIAAQQFRRGDLREEVSGIPFGQPILVGHHSERRHRKAIDRASRAFSRGIEAEKYAASLESRADAVGTAGISSDDPAAVVKLREKLARLEASRDAMKETNKRIRAAAKSLKVKLKSLRSDEPGMEDARRVLVKAGVPEAQQVGLLQSFSLASYQGLGYPGYSLSNQGAEIRRVKARLKDLIEELQRPEAQDVHHEGFYVTEDPKINRIQLVFEGKPGPQTRTALKQGGFRWSRRNSAWQRHLNAAGRAAAERVSGLITSEAHGGWLQNPATEPMSSSLLRAAYQSAVAAASVGAEALGEAHGPQGVVASVWIPPGGGLPWTRWMTPTGEVDRTTADLLMSGARAW